MSREWVQGKYAQVFLLHLLFCNVVHVSAQGGSTGFDYSENRWLSSIDRIDSNTYSEFNVTCVDCMLNLDYDAGIEEDGNQIAIMFLGDKELARTMELYGTFAVHTLPTQAFVLSSLVLPHPTATLATRFATRTVQCECELDANDTFDYSTRSIVDSLPPEATLVQSENEDDFFIEGFAVGDNEVGLQFDANRFKDDGATQVSILVGTREIARTKMLRSHCVLYRPQHSFMNFGLIVRGEDGGIISAVQRRASFEIHFPDRRPRVHTVVESTRSNVTSKDVSLATLYDFPAVDNLGGSMDPIRRYLISNSQRYILAGYHASLPTLLFGQRQNGRAGVMVPTVAMTTAASTQGVRLFVWAPRAAKWNDMSVRLGVDVPANWVGALWVTVYSDSKRVVQFAICTNAGNHGDRCLNSDCFDTNVRSEESIHPAWTKTVRVPARPAHEEDGRSVIISVALTGVDNLQMEMLPFAHVSAGVLLVDDLTVPVATHAPLALMVGGATSCAVVVTGQFGKGRVKVGPQGSAVLEATVFGNVPRQGEIVVSVNDMVVGSIFVTEFKAVEDDDDDHISSSTGGDDSEIHVSRHESTTVVRPRVARLALEDLVVGVTHNISLVPQWHCVGDSITADVVVDEILVGHSPNHSQDRVIVLLGDIELASPPASLIASLLEIGQKDVSIVALGCNSQLCPRAMDFGFVNITVPCGCPRRAGSLQRALRGVGCVGVDSSIIGVFYIADVRDYEAEGTGSASIWSEVVPSTCGDPISLLFMPPTPEYDTHRPPIRSVRQRAGDVPLRGVLSRASLVVFLQVGHVELSQFVGESEHPVYGITTLGTLTDVTPNQLGNWTQQAATRHHANNAVGDAFARPNCWSLLWDLDESYHSLALDPTRAPSMQQGAVLLTSRPLTGLPLRYPAVYHSDQQKQTQCVQIWTFAIGIRKEHFVDHLEISVNGQSLLNVSSVKSNRHAMGGNAMFDSYIHLAEDLPEWFCVENVPVFEDQNIPEALRLAVVSFGQMEWRDTPNSIVPINADYVLARLKTLPVFVLNLEKREERWRRVQGVCRAGGLNCTRFLGIDGRDPSNEAWITEKHKDAMTTFSWGLGQMACLEGHMAILREIANMPAGSGPAIVFEDDVDIHPSATEMDVARVLAEFPAEADIVLLGHCEAHYEHFNKDKLLQLGNAFCLHAYAVTPEAAPNLLFIMENALQSVDEEIRRGCVQGTLICYLSSFALDVDLGMFTGGVFIQDRSDGISDTRPAVQHEIDTTPLREQVY